MCTSQRAFSDTLWGVGTIANSEGVEVREVPCPVPQTVAELGSDLLYPFTGILLCLLHHAASARASGHSLILC